MWGKFLNTYQYSDPDLSATPCYEELNPAPILPEHVYDSPQLMKIHPSLDGTWRSLDGRARRSPPFGRGQRVRREAGPRPAHAFKAPTGRLQSTFRDLTDAAADMQLVATASAGLVLATVR